MNLFLILIPQSLNSQFLNLAPYSHYDEDGVQKSHLVLRSNNEVCIQYIQSLFQLYLEFLKHILISLNSGGIYP